MQEKPSQWSIIYTDISKPDKERTYASFTAAIFIISDADYWF